MWIGIFTIFGATFFAIIDASTQCVLGYGCDDIWSAMAKLFLVPQIEMGNAIDAINMKVADGTITEMDHTFYRKQIIAALLVTVILFIIFYKGAVKSVTTLNFGDRLGAAMIAIAIIAALQVIFGWLLYGEFFIPFIGVIKLFQTPDVLIAVINYSEVLPLNTTIPINGA